MQLHLTLFHLISDCHTINVDRLFLFIYLCVLLFLSLTLCHVYPLLTLLTLPVLSLEIDEVDDSERSCERPTWLNIQLSLTPGQVMTLEGLSASKSLILFSRLWRVSISRHLQSTALCGAAADIDGCPAQNDVSWS